MEKWVSGKVLARESCWNLAFSFKKLNLDEELGVVIIPP